MSNLECPARDTLKEYLSGWMETCELEQVESHLANCESCEQTILELEQDPDTLLEPLRGIVAMEAKGLSPVDQAIESAKRIIDSPQELPNESNVPPYAKSLAKPFKPYDLGAYELLSPLGRGGMGAVFLARHKQLSKQVAIKLLPSFTAAREEVLARFHREIRAAGRLNHPSIVAATDAGEQDGSHYLVMELIDGLDLSQLARAVGQLSIADACEIARQAALGLSYSHAQGIVHRDIKPSNLMLDTDGHAKILDFGLAQLSLWDEASQELTTVGQLMGTLDYMAPEQAERCGTADYRVDLYALGATLFRLLCGRPPLAASPNQSPLEKLRLLANERPPRLDTLRPAASPQLVDLVARLLAFRPEERPSSAAHIAELLLPFTAGADLVALGVSASARTAVSSMPDPIFEPQRHRKAPEDANSNLDIAISDRQSKPIELSTPISILKSAFPPRNRRRNLVAVALVPLAILAGVLVILELQKGELIIDSDVTGIKVNLLKDGQPYRELTLQNSPTTTRIFAGRYEVILDVPSDSVDVINGEFDIKNGKQVVAHIKQKAKSTIPETGAPQPIAVTDEPLYAGKPLSAWLDQLARDHSPQSIGESLVALKALAISSEHSEVISSAVMKALPNLIITNQSIVTGTSLEGIVTRSNLQTAAFEVLSAANPNQKYAEILVKCLESEDEALAIQFVTFSRSHEFQRKTDIIPLLDWFDTQLLTLDPLDFKKSPRQYEVTGMIMAQFEETGGRYVLGERYAIAELILSRLKNAKSLGREFWLAYLPRTGLLKAFNDELIGNALKAMIAMDTPPKYVAHAAMVLAAMPVEKWKLTEDEKTALASAVQRRLNELCTQPDRLFTAVDSLSVQVDSHIFEASGTFLLTQFAQVPFVLGGKTRTEYTNDTIELLDLVDILKKSGSTIDVVPLLDATREGFVRLGTRPLEQFEIGESYDLQSTSPYFPVAEKKIPVNADVKRDIIAYIIHVKSTELAGVKEHLPPKEPVTNLDVQPGYRQNGPSTSGRRGSAPNTGRGGQRGSIVPAIPNPTEPLYSGKPLSEWLDQLARDREPQSIGEAFDAISALVSPETSDQISDSLANIVLTLDPELLIQEKVVARVQPDGRRGTRGRRGGVGGLEPDRFINRPIYDRAIGILLRANAVPKYYELLARMLAEANPNWTKRLLDDRVGNRVRDLTPDQFAPLINWAIEFVDDVSSKRRVADGKFPYVAEFLRRNTLLSGTQQDGWNDIALKSYASLQKCDQVDNDFWLMPLAQKRVVRDDGIESQRLQVYPDSITKDIVARCFRILTDDGSPSKSVIWAANALKGLIESKSLIDDSVLELFVPRLATRLTELATDRRRMLALTQMGAVETQYPRGPDATLLNTEEFRNVSTQSLSEGIENETIELIDLIGRIPKAQRSKGDFNAAQFATKETFDRIDSLISELKNSYKSGVSIAIDFPIFKTVNLLQPGLGVHTIQQGEPFSQNLFELKPADWISYLIHRQVLAVRSDEPAATSE